ncbi:hypothetical protein ACKC9G_05570 [Pokkaliibacter sp. CJK22405]|uniref:hypothetical protein n=1 Tax=Pokkaliibacter sp. CJK22405 TaxID=3384615 RepID=UPI003984A1D1
MEKAQPLSLLARVDVGVAYYFSVLFKGIITLAIWLLGLVSLIQIIWSFFEYHEGLADLSWAEWGFLLFSLLLLRRHIHYCRHFGWGFWAGLSRLFAFQGIFYGVIYAVLGMLFIYLYSIGEINEFLLQLEVIEPADKLVEYGLSLLAIFLAIPTSQYVRRASNKPVKAPTAPPSEEKKEPYAPEVSVVVKEASL